MRQMPFSMIRNIREDGSIDCKPAADEFIKTLELAGEQAWLGWLSYVLERLDAKAVVGLDNPFFLAELFDAIDGRLGEGEW